MRSQKWINFMIRHIRNYEKCFQFSKSASSEDDYRNTNQPTNKQTETRQKPNNIGNNLETNQQNYRNKQILS